MSLGSERLIGTNSGFPFLIVQPAVRWEPGMSIGVPAADSTIRYPDFITTIVNQTFSR